MEFDTVLGAQHASRANDVPIMKYFWVLAIVCNVANAIGLKVRSRKYLQNRPELANGYQRLFLGYLVFGVLPWVVMGVGIVFGGVPGVFSYFNLQDPNPFIRAWFGCIIMMWLLGFYWIFARRGAEFLIEHPGMFNNNLDTPAKIKGLYCLTIVGIAVGLYVMLNNNLPSFNQ